MTSFAANLSMLYTEHGFLDRFAAAARDGFRAVEYLFPYEYAASQLAMRLRECNLQQVLFNLPAGNWEAGERGIACLPQRSAEFREGVERAIEYAHTLGCNQLNCLAGRAPAEVPREVLYETLIDNLRFASARLAKDGIRLLIEPVNTRDIPNFLLHSTRQAKQILESIGSKNLFIQYDAYHMQIMEGDLTHTVERLMTKIAHIQIADNPGRHEPGSGEINYRFFLRQLDRLGYAGWVGCEYIPREATSIGLLWMKELAKDF